MKISTRVRYGVRLMLGLALNYGKGPFFLKDIAKQEDISEKYLSQIIIPLKTVGLVNSFRGAHGGYSLAKLPSQVTIKAIVEALEGELTLVGPVKDSSVYSNASIAVTHELWSNLKDKMSETLDEATLEDLVKKYNGQDGKTLMYNI